MSWILNWPSLPYNELDSLVCPCCGYDRLDEPPYLDDKLTRGSYEVCSCCGFEYGFHDFSEGYSFKGWQEKWISEGFNFSTQNEQPEKWNRKIMEAQLKNIEKAYGSIDDLGRN